ncbi:sigma factor G inhibitor Gin [Desulfosporosinus sp.]|uniref:sigma factor G inhibitor Gin n=1 Tax=Desulfosporosinus sp. TaxID=157907 RepID=UPI000E989B5C|nr:sigma factor G inhibitor Gin [Desulfosporosinus sp.]MBC2727862.1 inhibitor of sigma-G Gin [Desulfosporosinus sp.]HBV86612.1 inhibitor of sigma-G Gin [Desulfosporosinus sp.]
MIKTTNIPDQGPSEISEKNEGLMQNEGKLLPVCYRCTKVPKEGLYDGFRVQGMFFCSECQQDLFTAEQGSPEYQEFMFLIKGIFY